MLENVAEPRIHRKAVSLGAAFVVVLALPAVADNRFEGGKRIESFAIACKTSSTHSSHWVYSDGTYRFFTENRSSGERYVMVLARPAKVEIVHQKGTFDSGATVEWSEIVVGINASGQIQERSAGKPDFMTIVFSTKTNPDLKSWTTLTIERQEAFIGPNGYLSSAFSSEKKVSGCSLDMS